MNHLTGWRLVKAKVTKMGVMRLYIHVDDPTRYVISRHAATQGADTWYEIDIERFMAWREMLCGDSLSK